MYDGKTGIAAGTSRKEFKTLTKYFSEECLTEMSPGLISCRMKDEGLTQGQCGGNEACDTCGYLIFAGCHTLDN